MTLAILILALIVATCIIAYIADNIGKNLGKKRISIMGLRPRQTATLISMAASVAIMLLTVAILMLTSASLRNALLRYDAEKKEANRRQREITRLQTEKDDLLKNVRLQREQNNAQLKEIALNRNRAAQFMKQRVEAERQLKSASVRLATARKGEADARARAREAQVHLEQARKQFETFKKQLADAKTRVAAAQERVQKAQAQVRDVQKQLNVEQGQVASARADLATAQAQLTDAQNNFLRVQAEVNTTLDQLTKAATEIALLAAKRDQLQLVLDAKNLELEDLDKQIKDYKEIAAGEIAIQMGEVFAEEVVPSHISTKDALAAIHRLLAAGREKLNESRRTFAIDIPETASQLTEEEFLSRFAAILSTREYPVSLRLTAARDHARGESKIFVRLVPIQIRTVFEKDDVLASAVIDAGDEDTRIFNRLLALLNESEQRARERGVAPLLTQDNPFFYPLRTNVLVFDALRRIQAMGGMVQVRLVAAENITTIDSPRVKFEITRQ